MSDCVLCQGKGRITALFSGRQAIWMPCRPCAGSGVAPDWQTAAVEAGKALKIRRQARGITLREEALRLNVTAVILSECERGARALDEWPNQLCPVAR